MPNIAAVLKSEIARIARKESKQNTLALKQVTGAYRREIAALKHRVQALELQLRTLAKQRVSPPIASEPPEAQSDQRFSAKGFASLRARLGLSAADLGALIGASALSVYKWESGKARPRSKYLSAIASIRGIGKREAAKRLEALR